MRVVSVSLEEGRRGPRGRGVTRDPLSSSSPHGRLGVTPKDTPRPPETKGARGLFVHSCRYQNVKDRGGRCVEVQLFFSFGEESERTAYGKARFSSPPSPSDPSPLSKGSSPTPDSREPPGPTQTPSVSRTLRTSGPPHSSPHTPDPSTPLSFREVPWVHPATGHLPPVRPPGRLSFGLYLLRPSARRSHSPRDPTVLHLLDTRRVGRPQPPSTEASPDSEPELSLNPRSDGTDTGTGPPVTE